MSQAGIAAVSPLAIVACYVLRYRDDTVLNGTNPVTRETGAYYRRRPLVVKLTPRTLEIREKGRRDTLVVDYGVLYEFALKLRWRQQQAEKKRTNVRHKKAH